jgi:hypothetical protein
VSLSLLRLSPRERVLMFLWTWLRADRPLLRIPKSFEQLQALNGLLKKYKTIYPVRTVVCFVVTYLL